MDFWKGSKQYAWIFGVLVGGLFLWLGISQEQFAVIWNKAVMICLECIGIG